MASALFDFTPLWPPGLPAPAAKWTGLAKYSFVGGNNDPDQVPVDGLIEAVNAVLRREGRTLATYGLASGPQGYRPLREFIVGKLHRDASIVCAADDILMVSGSLQALDLVNQALLARGDTVIVERDTYQGALTRLARMGVKTISVIDLSAAVPFVSEQLGVGDAPEGITFSPNGAYAAVTILQGSYDAPETAWFRHDAGAVSLLKIEKSKVSVVNSVDVGAFPEGVAFAPDNQHLYVGNFHSNSISILTIDASGHLADTGQIIRLSGPPASLRIGSQ